MEKVNAVIQAVDKEVIERIIDHLRSQTQKTEAIILEQVDAHAGYGATAKETAKQMVSQIFQTFYNALDTIVFVDEPGEYDTIN